MPILARAFRVVVPVALLFQLVSTASGQALTADPSGILLRGNIPFCAIGVNYVDAFWRHLSDFHDRSYEKGFADLSAQDIPFVRFAVAAYWPSQLRLYLTDRETYLRRLDEVVKAAERHNVGLVPSFFWAYFAVPDVVGEPVSRWGDPDSATIGFMRRFTADIVERYRDSPAIWAWEFGNEFSLEVDLPNAAEWRPPVNVALGTPPVRSAADELTTPILLRAFEQFASVVGGLDTRPISTGNSFPRSQAEQTRKTGQWKEPDRRADLLNNLQLVNPPHAYRFSSIHLYRDEVVTDRFAWGYRASYDELLDLAARAAREVGQVLFVGEFGASAVHFSGDVDESVKENVRIIDAIVRNRVNLAAVWVYDFPQQEKDGWNISLVNGRREILDSVRDANRLFRAGACTSN
jgi:hypothetical protein